METSGVVPDEIVLPPEMTHSNPVDITIVGLGPGAIGDLSLSAWAALTRATRIVLRTERHPCVPILARHFEFESLDAVYERHDDFVQLYDEIARRVVELGSETGGVVYAVPGHPHLGEATTAMILEQGHAAGLTVQVIGGVSFVAPSFAAVGVDAMDGAQVADAMILARQHHPKVEVGLPLLVGQVYARWLASDLKLTLMNAYPDAHEVCLVRAAGTDAETLRRVPLHELDRDEDQFDHLTSLYVPPLPTGSSVVDLQALIAHLRAPEGCPWDQEQTLETLRADLLDETTEVLEAIDAEAEGDDNSAHISEELGDLLASVVMMAQIATEEGRFQLADSVHSIVTKLVRRHPHVFGDAELDSYDELFANWEEIKAQERAEKGQAARGPLDGVPAALPALEKARKLQSKARKAGLFDREAIASSAPELSALLGDKPDQAAVGRLLWQLVALADAHDLNAEDALRAQTVQFRREHGE